ncbi:asparagine synthetase, glutamine-hydrolyzing [Legionella londiniensis]|nr:asparagine synthetase, glutamine-hydrolyzing [Legionella londiniensis]
MANAMESRGPDDEGYLIRQTNSQLRIAQGRHTANFSQIPELYRPETRIENLYPEKGDVFLAHRRLSIIDLKPTGHQPMATEDRRYWIIYNGEVFNYLEVAEELTQKGVTLLGHSDTEVILHAYALWGVEALQKFNGMFAFAIFDAKENTLFCARDRIGIKPFYYTIQNGFFIFASDIKTLIASGLYTPQVNLEGLYHAMSYGVAPRPLTSFKDVFALEQSHWLKINISTGKMVKESYWQIPVNAQDHALSEQKAVELLDEALTRSVKYQLHSDVPVGTFMSGGIDSTTISAIASKHHPHIKAFTLGFEGEQAAYLNEVDEARATAAMYDMEHIVHMQKPEAILDEINGCVKAYEEPFFSLSPNLIISKLVASHGVKVILNGLGGDELFAGYKTFQLAKQYSLLKLLLPFLKIVSLYHPRWRRALDLSYVKSNADLHGALLNNMSSFEKNRLFIDESVKELRSLEKLRELYVPANVQFDDYIEAMCYMYMMNYIGNHHVYRVDQFTMKYSIEGRFPFLDHNVVEAAFKIPSQYKLRGKVGKYILREVAKKYIDSSSLTMKKKGFDLPMDFWIRHVLNDLVQDKLNALSKRNLFHPRAIQSVAASFQKKRCDDYTLWQLVGIELWLEAFIDVR